MLVPRSLLGRRGADGSNRERSRPTRGSKRPRSGESRPRGGLEGGRQTLRELRREPVKLSDWRLKR